MASWVLRPLNAATEAIPMAMVMGLRTETASGPMANAICSVRAATAVAKAKAS